MYLSRIEIDLHRYETLIALQQLEKLHGMIDNSFTGDRQRTLWRIDSLGDKNYLLLCSPTIPDLSGIDQQIGKQNQSFETLDYDKFLCKLSAGSLWHFRLIANPTKSIPSHDERRGKVKAITIVAHQKEWLQRQSLQHGFLLDPNQFDVARTEWKIFQNKGRKVSLLSTTFEGLLTIADPSLFVKALTEGIGRGKAYGMGLLTVVRYE